MHGMRSLLHTIRLSPSTIEGLSAVAWRFEYGPRGIRVNAFTPGSFETEPRGNSSSDRAEAVTRIEERCVCCIHLPFALDPGDRGLHRVSALGIRALRQRLATLPFTAGRQWLALDPEA